MTREEKRIKLAALEGWLFKPDEFGWHFAKPCKSSSWWKYDDSGVPFPDYFNDLNAAHKLEKVLIARGGLPTYEHFLRFNEINDSEYWYGSIHATAAQRAEAIGKTLGLW
jgi:hypothetical protein